MKSAFSQKRPLIKQRIILLPLDKLLPHEQVVPSHVNLLKTNLKKIKFFIRPIVVAKDFNIILDGHHRVAALKELGYRKIPCVQIPNYLTTKEVVLGTWYPIHTGSYFESDAFFEALSTENIKWKEIPEFSPSSLSQNMLGFLFVTRTSFIQLFGDQKIIYSKFLEFCDPNTINYVKTIDYALKAIENGRGSLALLRRELTKDDVVQITNSGKVFAPKTTRHILSFRYQDIRLSLEKLK
jgi:hypothetical protein